TVVVDEDPVAAMVSLAEEKQPEVLVIATEGRTGLRRTLRRSVSEHVVRESPCPVLTVRRR
ncbi:MAG: universal stress protein, partial [Myxococcota bacterium]